MAKMAPIEVEVQVTVVEDRGQCPVRGGNGSGYGGCVARNCGAKECLALRKKNL